MPEFSVPVVDGDSGDGWDVKIEAEDKQAAIRKAMDQTGPLVGISTTYLDD